VGALALEIRPFSGGGRLRFGFEGGSFGRVIEGGAKYDFFDRGPIRPFLAAAVGGAAIDQNNAWRLEGAASAGLDLYLSKDFFATFELKERRFVQHSSSGSYYGLAPAPLYQTAAFAGVGIYL
jgi:hypothetical protein